MRKDAALVPGEVYHIYNRGAHKRDIFIHEQDYRRFQLLLHVSNATSCVNMRDMFSRHKGLTFADIFVMEKPDKELVEVLGYCLMPNHFHMILRQKAEAGISLFLHKLFTAYSMYFNAKHDHSGILSQGSFKSRHVDTESYLRYLFSYVHLNPLELIEPEWETGVWRNISAAKEFLKTYPYSSFYDYGVGERPERSILAYEQRPDFLATQNDLEELMRWYQDGKELTKV